MKWTRREIHTESIPNILFLLFFTYHRQQQFYLANVQSNVWNIAHSDYRYPQKANNPLERGESLTVVKHQSPI